MEWKTWTKHNGQTLKRLACRTNKLPKHGRRKETTKKSQTQSGEIKATIGENKKKKRRDGRVILCVLWW